MQNKNNHLSVLLTCVGSQVIPSVTELIRSHPDYKIRIIGVDTQPKINSVGAWFCDSFYQVPQGDAQGFLEKIEDIIDEEGVRVVIPGSEEEVLSLSKEKKNLKDKYNCQVVSSPYNVVKTAASKLAILNELSKLGMKLCRYSSIKSIDDISRFAENIGYPDNNFIIKPISSRGSRGFHIITPKVDNRQVFYSRDHSRMTLEALLTFFKNYPDDIEKCLLMEYLPGDKYSSDILVEKGKIASMVTRCNGPAPKLNPPTQLADIVFDNDVREYATEITEKLGFDYFIQIETGRDLNNNVRFIETNPRTDATLPITLGLGINFYHEFITYAIEGTMREGIPYYKSSAKKLRFFRRWQEVFIDK